MIIFFIIFFSLFSLYNFTFNHVDITSPCYIGITSESFRGERKTVKQALYQLKKTDFSTYKDVCKNVNIINEKRCLPGDPRGDPDYKIPQIEGCYIKGTHTIYINPTQDRSYDTVLKRSEQIARYGTYCTEFWN